MSRMTSTVGGRTYVLNTDIVEMVRLLREHRGATAEREAWPYTETREATFARPRLVFVPGSVITVSEDRPLGQALPHLVGQQVTYLDHLDVVGVDGTLSPWAPPPADVTATDWEVSWPDPL